MNFEISYTEARFIYEALQVPDEFVNLSAISGGTVI